MLWIDAVDSIGPVMLQVMSVPHWLNSASVGPFQGGGGGEQKNMEEGQPGGWVDLGSRVEPGSGH